MSRTAITNTQIRALMREAAQAGDEGLCVFCRLALSGDSAAREVCAFAQGKV